MQAQSPGIKLLAPVYRPRRHVWEPLNELFKLRVSKPVLGVQAITQVLLRLAHVVAAPVAGLVHVCVPGVLVDLECPATQPRIEPEPRRLLRMAERIPGWELQVI